MTGGNRATAGGYIPLSAPMPIKQQSWAGDVAPIVSVLCTTYNHERFIRECLEQILVQETLFPVELIIHDDASTDRTQEIVREYCYKYPLLLRPIFQVRNQRSRARKAVSISLNMARGRYVALCEGDDYWTSADKLQKQVDFLEKHPEYAICFHQAELVNENGEFIRLFNESEVEATYCITDLTQSNFIATASCVFRRSHTVLPGWIDDLPAADWGLHMLNAELGNIHYMPNCMSAYRIHNGGVWSSLGHEEMIRKGVEVMRALDMAFEYKYTSEFQQGIEKRLSRLVEKPRGNTLRTRIREFLPRRRLWPRR